MSKKVPLPLFLPRVALCRIRKDLGKNGTIKYRRILACHFLLLTWNRKRALLFLLKWMYFQKLLNTSYLWLRLQKRNYCWINISICLIASLSLMSRMEWCKKCLRRKSKYVPRNSFLMLFTYSTKRNQKQLDRESFKVTLVLRHRRHNTKELLVVVLKTTQ